MSSKKENRRKRREREQEKKEGGGRNPAILFALGIAALRVGDVTLNVLRTVFTVQGRKGLAAVFAGLGVWLAAAGIVFADLTGNWGVAEEDIIIDCLTFPISTGQEEVRRLNMVFQPQDKDTFLRMFGRPFGVRGNGRQRILV